ncbi:MAG TPA: hypothetical protein PK110_03395 [Niabella sp.]|jgi:hypothetical protein|nr:hypothetical protein [Chitinophagaceae bacterium]HRO83846.1 hypothetical protein [Niabella sp.]HUN02379.1 hypothetical protein [Niabella sp.]
MNSKSIIKNIFFTFCFLLIINQLAGQAFKVGAAYRVITPNPLLPVSGGIGPSKPVKEKKGDLYARALVFEKEGTRVAIVSIDNLGWPAALGDKSRALIKGIPPENVLIGVTHTHSAPDAYGFPDETGHVSADLKYLNWCVQQVADAVNEAIKNLKPASLKIAVGEAKGKIAYNYYAPDLYDPRCGVIQALDQSGKPIATLINYAIHPEIIGSGRGILSPDLCGPLYERIEAAGGGMAIFMNSAQGGMVTADNRRPDGKEANDWDECVRIGNLLADQAIAIIEKAPVEKNPGLFCASRKISLPVDNEIIKAIIKFSPLEYKGFENDSAHTVLNLLNIGTAQIITVPGEALPNIGYYIKRKMKTRKPFLFGLTNDAFGYMLTKVDFDSFKRYRYISQTSLSEMVGEVYINEVLDWLKQAPAPAME